MNLPLLRPPHDNGHAVERRSLSFHDVLATITVMGFFIICVAVMAMLMASSMAIEAAVAGIIGAILGYWANSATQIMSYYFGSASSVQAAAKGTVSRLVRGRGPPPVGVGTNGDEYYDEEAKQIYGPKAGGAWGGPRDAAA